VEAAVGAVVVIAMSPSSLCVLALACRKWDDRTLNEGSRTNRTARYDVLESARTG